ncbi:MAG: NusG domain II-containing protein [Eubacterium sp.]|nr:NusG domain II-containing protein [Eubacteriales bacterium]MDY4109940.1 NusG domain II-containing protein [Eubacterium sp.]
MQNKKRKNDIILIVIIIALSAMAFILINSFSSSGNEVIIEQNLKQTAVLNINKNQEYNLYDNNGNICNTVLIKDGTVSMKYANCKDKICVNHNKISKNNESIICLPNKVVVTVVSDKNNDVDEVAR